MRVSEVTTETAARPAFPFANGQRTAPRSLNKYTRITAANWLTGRRLLPLLREIGERQTGTVIDLGAGEAPFKSYFAKARRYIKIDRRPNGSIDIIAQLPKLPLRDRLADLIFLAHVLTDVAETDELLREISRVLRPGGTLLVLESTCYPPHDLPCDYYRFLPNGLAHAASKASLAQCSVHHLGGLFTRLASLVNTFFLGRIQNVPLIGIVASSAIAVVNVLCWVGDRLRWRPELGESYLASFRKPVEC
jgi:SAM-dependent methyltransferase